MIFVRVSFLKKIHNSGEIVILLGWSVGGDTLNKRQSKVED